MARLLRSAPLTPLDALRALLAEYQDGDGGFGPRLTQSLQSCRRQLLRELGARLGMGTTPKGLKRAILAQIARFDWPEWAPWLREALAEEGDLQVFDEGCAALGALGTREAIEALRTLQARRTGPDHRVILERELALFHPTQPAAHYLGRLQEGAGNPKLALQGARMLAALAGPELLPALAEAWQGGDELVRRLVLRLVSGIPGAEALAFLQRLLEQGRRETQESRLLESLQHRLHTVSRGAALPELMRTLAEHFRERSPEAVERLLRLGSEEIPDAAPELEALRAASEGPLEAFLVEGAALLLEGKQARFTAYLSEASSTTEEQLVRLAAQCDLAAEALARKVDLGHCGAPEVLPGLMEALRERVGGEGLIQACLRLVPATEAAFLEELLADPDLERRQKVLHALGSREDDSLVPFFLRAMQDPIVEVGQQAIHHLGKLPGSFQALAARFDGGQTEQVRLAIRVFGENQTAAAVERLIAFVEKDGRDELLVEAVDALGTIRDPRCTATLLDQLHDGKPLALQLAIARTLGALGTPEASLGLLQKAPGLKHPQVLLLCLEGALAAFPDFDHPLPAAQVSSVLQLVERLFDSREGEGQRLPTLLALQDLYAFDRDAYEQLKERFSDQLFDMRTKEQWDREANERVAAVIKEMGRRSDALGKLASKEAELRARLANRPEPGPKRAEALLALRECLADPELILRPELARELAGMVGEELQRGGDWREVAHLCELGGRSHQPELVEPIRMVYLRATGLGLKSAARSALLALGLAEEDLNRLPPVRSILVLEPSAFFRKRLLAALEPPGRWEIREAAERGEAEALLAEAPADLLLSERQDPEGPLDAWILAQWEQQRITRVLLSTARRDPSALAEHPCLLGTLFKPYPPEQLLNTLQG